LKEENKMKERIKSFLCRKANPLVIRRGTIHIKAKKSISFNLDSALSKCYDY